MAKYNKITSVRILIKIGYFLGISMMIYIFTVLGINEYNSIYSREKWLNSSESRILIVEDMLSKNNLIGRSKQEVIKLLGVPTNTDYFKTESNIVYYLGPEPSLISIDSAWLVIEFNKDNKVNKYDIMTD